MRPRVEEKTFSPRTIWEGSSLTWQHTGLPQVFWFTLMYISLYQPQCVCLLNTPSLLGWCLRKKIYAEPIESLCLGMTIQSWCDCGLLDTAFTSDHNWGFGLGHTECEVRQEPPRQHTRPPLLPTPAGVTIPRWVYKLLDPVGKQDTKGTFACGS